MKLALKVHDADNVAILFGEEIENGDVIEVLNKSGEKQQIIAASPIPYGHKIAVSPISKGATILKYGESIGVADADISVGEHVHVHNLGSTRGRGDL